MSKVRNLYRNTGALARVWKELAESISSVAAKLSAMDDATLKFGLTAFAATDWHYFKLAEVILPFSGRSVISLDRP